MIRNDSIEIIEENIIPARAHLLCQDISNHSEKLWCFSVRKCIINNIEFEKLIRALKHCKSLRYINFNLNLINSFERVTYLATLLPCLNYLDTLCLHSSNLNDNGLRVLYYSLINNGHLRSLDIGDCGLSDHSVPIIKELIRRKEHDKGLYELIISSNQNITSVGWSQILIAIAAAADIKYFHMDYNNLDDSCGYLIAAILTSNHSLEVLDLEHTGITNKTALLLAYLVRNYRLAIRTLNLMHNDIDPNLQKDIEHFVENEYNVETIQVRNDFQDENDQPLRKNSIGANNTNNQSYDIRLRDMSKMDKYVQDGSLYNKQNKKIDCLVGDYERQLQRDYNEVKERIDVEKRWEEKEATIELLEPTENLRYKRHVVLPFNDSTYA